ncbi:purine-nucleoside phosphorylase [candidate division WOR-3 bacterium]|nr:purine-nucleoside phosphorylase [candidate division WOR-3 bacterium]
MTSNYRIIQSTTDFLKENGITSPEILVILGSGQNNCFRNFNLIKSLKYSDIPHFPTSTVKGHKGELQYGSIENKNVLIMNGRFHLYEGYSAKDIAIPIQISKLLGVKILIVTNAAGGINRYFKTGDIIIINDHINLTGQNPLIGPNIEDIGERFTVMNNLYTIEYRNKLVNIAASLGIKVMQGVYAGLLGPNLETGAELTMLKTIGADLVGMSTVAEVVAAKHANMEIVGLSIVTNSEFPGKASDTSHDKVIDVASKAVPNLMKLIEEFIKSI